MARIFSRSLDFRGRQNLAPAQMKKKSYILTFYWTCIDFIGKKINFLDIVFNFKLF